MEVEIFGDIDLSVSKYFETFMDYYFEETSDVLKKGKPTETRAITSNETQTRHKYAASNVKRFY